MADSGFNPDILVGQASSWSLAGDSRLLEALQHLSTQLSQQTKQVQHQLDQLAVTTSKTATRLANTTNNFMLLSNTQFIEARVYEDAELEVSGGVDEAKVEVVKSNEELLEQSNQLICGALKLGINVIETAFEKVEIDDSDSDEDEAHPSEVVLQPKNPYHVRPLPYVIGTEAFHDDDHVGLIDEEELSPLSDDDESEESDTESEHPEEDDKVSEYSVSDDEVTTKPPTHEKQPKVDHFFSEDSESEFSDDDLFGASKEKKEDVSEKAPSIDSKDDHLSGGENTDENEEPVPKMPSGPMSFTSELSAKLGLGSSLPSKTSEKPKDTTDNSQADDKKSNTSVASDKVGKSKKSVMFDSSSDSEDDLFKPTKPLAKKSSVPANEDTSTKKSSVPANEDTSTKTSSVPANEDTSTNETKAKEKIPTGGVSIFGPAKPSSKKEVNEEVKPTKADVEKPKVSLSQKPKLDSLFDDLSDDDDLFADIKVVTASAKTKKATAPQRSENKKNIFNDDDIFSSNKTTKKESVPNSNNEKERDTIDDDLFSEKKPAKTDRKNISIFGDMDDDDDDDLFADLVIKKKPSSSSKAPKPKESVPDEKTETSKNNETAEDFDSIDKNESQNTDYNEASKIRKPIGGVSMFGGINPKSFLKTSPDKETNEEIVKNDYPEINPIEIKSKISPEKEGDKKYTENKSIADTENDTLDVSKETVRASAPAVLVSDKNETGHNISKSTDLSNDKTPPETYKTNDSPSETVKDVVDKGAGPPSLLVSVGKSRPKVKSNRRPPSRGARHAAVKAAEEEAATNAIIEDGDDDIKETVPAAVIKDISPKRQSPFGGVNLFGGVSPTDVLKKRSPTPTSKTEDQADSKERETTNQSKATSPKDSESPQALPSNSPPSSSFSPPPMSSFSPPPMTTTPPLSSFSPPPMTTTPPLSSFSPPPMTEDETTSPGSLFGSSFEDPAALFPPTSSKIGASTVDNLFGESDDDDDLFGISVPTPKTDKKEVKSKSSDLFGEDKSKKAAPSLFDDESEDDDLFASLASSKKK